jgi:hypothetical protein
MQEIRISRRDRDDILNDPQATPVQKAQAHADFFTLLRAAATDSRLNRSEIADAASISRQRLHQILSPPQPRTTTVRLPPEDV